MKGQKLYVLRSGIITDMPREMLLQTGAPVDMEDVVELPIQSYVIEHPEGVILYDTGHSRAERYFTPAPEKEKPAWSVPEEDELPNQLSRLGISFGDVKYVICSHLHIDHTGYLELFKDAEIIVCETEFAHAAKMNALGKLEYPFVNKDYEAWIQVGLNWRLVEKDETEIQLLEGLKIFNFGSGHSYGMLGLLIELEESGNKLIISDAIYCRDNVGPPVVLPGFIVDNDGYKKSVAMIQEIAKQYNAEIWFGHDMEQFNNTKLMDEGFYC